jgi:hypothetical protein
MKAGLKSFALILLACVALSLVLALFNGRSLAALIDIGSYIGAAAMLLGCWRTLNGPTDVIQDLHMNQRLENLDAQRSGRRPVHTDMVPMFLSSGPLAFAGLFWLVILQAIRYGFGIAV